MESYIRESLKIQSFLDELMNRHENKEIEFKSAHGGFPGSFWESYSSFANTDGGIILFGVKEKNGVFSAKPHTIEEAAKLRKTFFSCQNDKDVVSIPLLSDRDVLEVPYNDGLLMAFIVPRAGREQRPVYVGRDPMTGTFRRNDEGDYRCKLSTNVLSSDVLSSDVLSSDVLSLNVSSMNNLTCKTSRTSESKTDVSSPGEEYLDVPSSDMISPQEKKMVLEFCSTWRSASEIAHRIGRNRQHTLRRIIKRMVNLGLLVMEFPNTPTSPKQRYKHRE